MGHEGNMIEMIVTKGEPDSVGKRCADCFYCRGAVSWWCTNKEAAEYRGTRIPGVMNCHFWKPARKVSELGWFEYIEYRLFGRLTVLPIDCTTFSDKSAK